MRLNSQRYGLYGLLSLMLASGAVQADVPVTVKVTLLEPACQVSGENGETQLEMPFGDVAFQYVGTAKAEQSVNIRVTCSGGPPAGKSLKMYFTPTSYGIVPALGQNVLGTSMTGVGIALTNAQRPFNIGQGLPIQAGLFRLTGQLVMQDGTNVEVGGEFSASASLFATYM
ncbi:fimbrial protein [Pragia fontium]|uniref:Fimbrial protein n=2 Tax=Pragia fontium TaxID=82985 RepID=A0AAJ5BFV8_9GAMM|nr:fimbrial protein [Pragia fontium]GKX62837.1 hypothetical protein SOASR032_14060 [Pragia fontium]SFC06166.1 Fimbrial protein [Pragia fontium DSM 5563 = ATCC 49100]SUB81519.1 Minor fimbrial protein prsF precursor [Pragia fontium]VEJ53901.1 Minor fimbrial protein prsF precursor [Pragia fontium]